MLSRIFSSMRSVHSVLEPETNGHMFIAYCVFGDESPHMGARSHGFGHREENRRRHGFELSGF